MHCVHPSSNRTKSPCADAAASHHQRAVGDATVDAVSTVEKHRRLIAAAIAKLRECGNLVTTCTIRDAMREHLGVGMSLREIIEARRP
jgi:hypothetical protein